MNLTLYLEEKDGVLIRSEFCHFQEATLSLSLKQASSYNPNLAFTGTDFQNKVWKALVEIPQGSLLSYKEIAEIMEKPRAYRAVANAIGANKIAFFIPCHRVVRANRSLGGYKWGSKIKQDLIRTEALLTI